MGFRFKFREPVATAARRVVAEQIERAAAELSGDVADPHKAVHQARKRFKKIRAALRLVRPAMGSGWRTEDAWFRDAGRDWSRLRDATTLIESLEYLNPKDAPPLAQTVALREALMARRAAIAQEADGGLPARLGELATALREAQDRVAAWPLEGADFELIAQGVQAVYREGRKAMRRARRLPQPERFHEWRKRVKDHWYHVALLRGCYPEELDGRHLALGRLATLLGEAQDLTVLETTLHTEAERFAAIEREPVHARIAAVIAQRRADAFALGERIYAEKPKAFRRRIGRCWTAWQK